MKFFSCVHQFRFLSIKMNSPPPSALFKAFSLITELDSVQPLCRRRCDHPSRLPSSAQSQQVALWRRLQPVWQRLSTGSCRCETLLSRISMTSSQEEQEDLVSRPHVQDRSSVFCFIFFSPKLCCCITASNPPPPMSEQTPPSDALTEKTSRKTSCISAKAH